MHNEVWVSTEILPLAVPYTAIVIVDPDDQMETRLYAHSSLLKENNSALNRLPLGLYK